MTTFLLRLFRRVIIRRLQRAYYGDQFINNVLEALKLGKVGLPDYKNIPPPPPVERKYGFVPPKDSSL